ncbi:MAG: DUF362 domain-containing protein [bacterium]
MSKVFFLKNFDQVGTKTRELLGPVFPADSQVMVKMHFGEPGNKFTFVPEDIKPITEAMKSLNLRPVLFDSPVRYISPRGSVESYTKLVKEKGYDKLAPCLISNNGKEVEMKDFIVQVCQELVTADNVLVVSRVKGHKCSGFGGAIKNLGMGGVTKETKALEHNLAKPVFVSECLGCGICAESCPVGAIKMVQAKAEINLKGCIGCSICQQVCPSKCLAPQKAGFDDLLAQAASAVINSLPKKTFYINFIKNITALCDCANNPGKVISEDVGVLFSDNPAAIDKASIDLINQLNGRDLFQEVNNKDPLLHVRLAVEYTGKELDYELVLI